MNLTAAVLVLVSIMFSAAQVAAETAGERLFNQKCIMCHVVRGKGGAIGPELTRAGTMMSDAQIRSKMMYPKKSHPSSSMPSFQTLPKGDFDAIVIYVRSLK